jgi:UDP-2-acetamido-2-deoxy-ribo-hexuluronate aminotransferase
MDRIRLHDLKRISTHIQKDLDRAYRDVMDEANYLRGTSVGRLEQAWAEYTGAEDCCAMTSGSDALHTAAMLVGIKPGDEIICCSHSYIATVEGFLHEGADVKWVDSKISDYCIDEAQIEQQITDKTKAIVWTDINGQSPDIDRIVAIARKHKLWTVKDAAPSAGSRYKGKLIGHKDHGIDITCFSFGPVKNFGAIGGAGAITGSKEICDEARQIKNHGRDKNHTRYDHTRAGWNRNIHTLQAAFLLAKLPYLDELNERRRQHAMVYNKRLSNAVNHVPVEQPDQHHTYHLYSVLVTDRKSMGDYLQEHNIEALSHWPKGLHDYTHTPNSPNRLVNTDTITSQTLSLPCSPFLTESERDYVIDHVHRFHEQT